MLMLMVGPSMISPNDRVCGKMRSVMILSLFVGCGGSFNPEATEGKHRFRGYTDLESRLAQVVFSWPRHYLWSVALATYTHLPEMLWRPGE